MAVERRLEEAGTLLRAGRDTETVTVHD